MGKAYFPLYVGDYRKDTYHLGPREHGAYLLLLFHLWESDGTMPDDVRLVRRITGLSTSEMRTTWHKHLRPFFRVENGEISHPRVVAELEKRAKTLQKRSKAGSKGGKKTQQKQREAQANAKASQAKGLASTPYRVERPSLDAKPSESFIPDAADSAALPAERGSGLSAEARSIWRDITRGSTGYPAISVQCMRDLELAVQGFDGETFIIGSHAMSKPAFELVQGEARKLGVQVIPEQQTAKLISIKGAGT
ncbi:MAG: DUF1376 domain-containing protein [Pseudomonadota bacterium]